MSINKHMLSVTNTWTKVFSPSDDPTYMYNFSGTAVQVYLSDKEVADPTKIKDEYFVIGGSIGQFKADKTKYVYAKANVGDTEIAPVMVDNMTIAINDVDAIIEELNGVTGQLAQLTLRVTDNELWEVKHDTEKRVFDRNYARTIALLQAADTENSNNYKSLLERLIIAETLLNKVDGRLTTMETDTVPTLRTKLEDTAATLQENISALTSLTLQIMSRLVTAENWISEHEGEYKILKQAVDNIKETIDTGTSGDLSNLVTKVNDLANRMETAETNINLLNEEVEKISGGSTVDVTELAKTVKNLNTEFTSLNNIISQITNKHTADEITEVFNLLIETVPDDQKDTLTGIKDTLLMIVSNEVAAASYYDGSTLTTDSKLLMEAAASDILY